jgi:hypothetical protein
VKPIYLRYPWIATVALLASCDRTLPTAPEPIELPAAVGSG